ncbi:MAG: hypothetical protein GXO05_05125 [Aquificae bacterium]|nr:hypothetical protein [Aquificota bacterium]
MEDSFIYLGRQPILDRHKKIVAYEILYRKSFEAFAKVEDESSGRRNSGENDKIV